jgi:hypothetical protein
MSANHSQPDRDPDATSGCVHLLEELDDGDGWRFRVAIDVDPDRTRQIELRLGFADYNHWSPSGHDTPWAVGLAAMVLLVEALGPRDLPFCIDAARLRRLIADADARVSATILDRPR